MSGTYGYQQLFTESVSAVTATPSVALGTRRLEGGCEYVYIYNAGTTAAVGYGMISSLNSAFTCVVSAALGDMAFGVVKNASITTEAYGWLCVKGLTKVQMGDTATGNTTAATGQGLYVGANGAFEPVTTGATGSTWAHCNVGATLATINTGASGSAYVNCLG